ncbi:hypothetical protein CW745_12100 [Psychromonas sp. psych-6C06]|uniref:hypothetical protein n=1 Tax=Psychromonas sp. psych-6C06 TaxID=2058089 RepID=UPI000C345D25|nr:hypothetical protein [Psychromonas sp. psych-6C06]PKF61048.1 hypothetical protein CW745_12100 [Psychromonas sp. psych-6C06]
MSKQFCSKCNHETLHKELIKQKPSKFGTTRKEKFRAFISGFIAGSASPVGAALDLMDRYVVCQQCGCKRLDNQGDEFQ